MVIYCSTGIVVLYNEDYVNLPLNPIEVAGTVYYKNTNNWSKVYAYYWSEENTQMTAWPGVQMTYVGSGVYSIEIPEGAEYIIFNDGNGSQTSDIALQGIDKIYNNGSWSNY